MNLRRFPLLAAATAMLGVLTGCPNPNTYTTPRTVPAGKVQIIPSAEGVGVTTRGPSTYSFYSPTLPSVGVRIGLADRMDLGFRLSNFTTVEGDFKFNFLRSRVFDMAVDPGVQGGYYGGGNVGVGLFYFNLPLLLGINFNKMASLILTPGFTYLVVTADDNTSGTGAFYGGSLPLARLGVGVNIRIGDMIGLQPEVTALQAFNSAAPTFWNFGFGVIIGAGHHAMPDYSDQN